MYWLFVLAAYCLVATGFYTYLAMTAQDEPSETDNDLRIVGAADWKRLPESGQEKMA